jgi:DNA-binding NtrC family response regulator
MPRTRLPRILVVDDDPAVRTLLSRALTAAGYEVVSAADARAGWVTARDATPGFDLVVTNTFRPDLTGEQLIAQLRDLFPELPIIHVDDLRLSFGEPGRIPNRVSPAWEPFSLARLLDAVRTLLDESAGSARLDEDGAPPGLLE